MGSAPELTDLLTPEYSPGRLSGCQDICLPIVVAMGQCRDLSVSAFASSGDNGDLHLPITYPREGNAPYYFKP